MIKLEKEFIMNADSCGDHKFTQIMRNDKFALYSRKKLNGDIFGYEIFKIKVTKAGSLNWSGIPAAEDSEVYPTKNHFGKSAAFYSTKTEMSLNTLNRLFESFVSSFKTHLESNECNVISNFILPDGQFTTKKLIENNPTKNYTDCHLYIQSQLGKTLKFVGEQRLSARGKPSKIYERI